MVFCRQARTKSSKGNLHPMRKVTPITEQFQHFVENLQESFWGDGYGKTRLAWKQFLEQDSPFDMLTALSD